MYVSFSLPDMTSFVSEYSERNEEGELSHPTPEPTPEKVQMRNHPEFLAEVKLRNPSKRSSRKMRQSLRKSNTVEEVLVVLMFLYTFCRGELSILIRI